MKSFIVDFWSIIFGLLRRVSFFEILRRIYSKLKKKNITYGHVDIWVSANLATALLLTALSCTEGVKWWEAVGIIYGAIRVFEVFVYQINVLLFDEYRAKKDGKPYKLRSYRRMVILLLQNYVEIVFWFALFYRNISWQLGSNDLVPNSIFGALRISFSVMTSLGNSILTPEHTFGSILVFSQSVIGLFMVLLVISRFISIVPEPETMDEFEK